MGYDESREGYERAHAEHRAAHGPGGERGRYAPLLPKELVDPAEPIDWADAQKHVGERVAKLAQLGACVLEILKSMHEAETKQSDAESERLDDSIRRVALVHIDHSARSLGLLGEEAKP